MDKISQEARVVNVTGGKEVELTPLSGRIPKQRLVQKYPRSTRHKNW